MKFLRPSSQFKKDIKRIKNNPQKAEALRKLLALLENDVQLLAEYKVHKLSGDYKDCLECHVENDLLLIWIDPDTDEIFLLRLGSHSELFGKGSKK